MGSISMHDVGPGEAAWGADDIVIAEVLGAGTFRFPGSEHHAAQAEGEALPYVRIHPERSLKGREFDPSGEILVFSPGPWFHHTHARLIRDGVISYVESRYRSGLDPGALREGDRALFFLRRGDVPAEFPLGSTFLSVDGGVDQVERAEEVAAAIREGRPGYYDQPLYLKVGDRLRFDGGLALRLVGHSHKRPRVDGPQCATTILEASLGAQSTTLYLNRVEDPDSTVTWGRATFGDCTIELVAMEYDRESTLIVRKEMGQRP